MEIPIPDSTQLADQLKALGHPVRLQIVNQLKAMESCCCSEMCDCFSQSQSTISQHLSVLKEAGLLKYSKVGNRSCFSLNHKALSDLQLALGMLAEKSERMCNVS